MKKILGHRAEIKAAGGIKTLSQVLNFIKAGATRIGTSEGVEIMKELKTVREEQSLLSQHSKDNSDRLDNLEKIHPAGIHDFAVN